MKPARSDIWGERTVPPSDIKPMLARHLMLPGHEIASTRVHRRDTIARLIERANWQFRLPTICIVNGEPVLRSKWRRRRIKATDEVCFVSKPWGKSGAGKQIFALVAIVALSVLAPGWGTAIAGALALPATVLGVSTASLIAAGIIVGGSLLVNALIAPKPGGQNDQAAFPAADPIYSVSASGNVGKPFQPIPVNYGKLKLIPDFAATPWSEFEGNDQYLNVLLSLGCGKYLAEQYFIDDTVFWDSVNGYDPQFADITTAQYGPGENVTLFPINITQAIEVSGQELPDPALPPTPGWIGGFVANAAGTEAQALAIDFVFPGGLYTVDTETGDLKSASVTVVAEARTVNDAGAPTGPYSALFTRSVSLATRNPQRITEKVDVTPGRYEVRFRRTSSPLGGTAGYDAVAWAGLRAFLNGPSSFPGVTTIAIRIKANAQFNANSAKRFGVLATRILPVWNGTAFVEQPTANPYWAFYDAATDTDYGARRPLSKIDFQNVVDSAAAADERGDTFNFSFNQVTAIPQAFDTILKAARSRHRWSGDVLTTVRDEWRAVPEMLLTDREIIRGSLSVDWLFNTDDSADSVILEYLDEGTWRAADVQYPPNSDDFISTNPARARLDGVTNREHAYREAAFIYLQSQKRRTNITLDTEHDGRRLGFGSAVRVQSELPQSWGATGTVVSRASNALTLDPAPDWSETGQHYIGIRDKRGRLFGPVKCSKGATDSVANLDPSDLVTVEGAGQTLDEALARATGADDPSFAFGVGSTWSKPCVVLQGRPNGDKVTLSLFVDDEDVHETELGVSPTSPQVPDLVDNKAPQITGLYAVFTQGVAEPVLNASWWPSPGAVYYLAQVSYDAGESWTQIYEESDNGFSKTVDLAALRLRVSAVGARRGAWVSVDVDAPEISIDKRHLSIDVQAELDKIQPAFDAAIEAFRTVADPTIETALDMAGGDAAIGALLKTQTERMERIDVVTAVQSRLNDPLSGLDAKASASQLLSVQTSLEGDITAQAEAITSVTAKVGPYTQSASIGAVVTNIYAAISMITEVGGNIGGFILNNDGTTSSAKLLGNLIVSGTITATQIASHTITAAQITAGTITATEIASDAITAGKIAAGAIDAGNILVDDIIVTGHLRADAATYVQNASGTNGVKSTAAALCSMVFPVAVGNVWIIASIFVVSGVDSTLVVKRDGTTIDSINILTTTIASGDFTIGFLSGTFILQVYDNPSVGNHTYTLELTTGSLTCANVRMLAMESRR